MKLIFSILALTVFVSTAGLGAQAAAAAAADEKVAAVKPSGDKPAQSDPGKDKGPAAILQGLDKVTARISTFAAPLGKTVSFGALRIVARACKKHPPEETPESSAFLEIEEVKPDEAPTKLFSGWMFASSPALSSLEDPVYDVWVIDCRNSSSSSADRSR